jgi:hypothetical protein
LKNKEKKGKERKKMTETGEYLQEKGMPR